MIVAPPFDPGAEKVTVALVDPVAVAVPIVGALGAVFAAVAESENVVVLEPLTLFAVTVYVAELAVALGVPEIAPVTVEKLNPDGRVELMLHEVAD